MKEKFSIFPIQNLDHTYINSKQIYIQFIWNSNFTECPVFYLATLLRNRFYDRDSR